MTAVKVVCVCVCLLHRHTENQSALEVKMAAVHNQIKGEKFVNRHCWLQIMKGTTTTNTQQQRSEGRASSVNEKKMKGAACEEAQQSVATNEAPICAAEAFAAHTTFGHYAEVSN